MRLTYGSFGSVFLVLGLAALSGAAVAETTEDTGLQSLRDLLAGGEYGEAQKAARSRLDDLEGSKAGESAEAGDVLDVLVESLWRSGKAYDPETLALAERALAVKSADRGRDDPSVAESLNNLAILRFFRGEYLEARPLWERALVLRTEALGSDHPKSAHMMNNLANLLTMTGEYDRAREMYQSALAAREKAYGPEHVSVGDTLGNLALVLTNIGDYSAALRISERAVEVKRRALGTDHPKYPSSLSSLGTLLWRMGDFDRARPLLEEAADLYRKTLGEEHPFVGQSLNNLAELLRAAGDLAGARERYEQSLAVLEKAYGPDHPEVGLTLDNLADLLEETGDPTAAETYYRRAVAIREESLGAEHPDLAESLLSLGMLEAKTGDPSDVKAILERVVSIRENALGADHPQVSEALTGLAAVTAAGGGSGEALALALRAERIGRDHLRLTGRSLTEHLAIRYAGVRNRGLDLALSLAADGFESVTGRPVLDSLIRSRAVVLDEMAARQHSVAGSSDPAIARLADGLASARTRLANLTVRGLGSMSPEAYRTLLDEARRDRDDAENALAAASASFARERDRGRLGLEEVKANLPDDGALVAYVLYDRSSFRREKDAPVRVDLSVSVPSYLAVVATTGSDDPVMVPLGPAEEIDSLVKHWKREILFAAGAPAPERAAERYHQAGGALRERIWDPVAAKLDGAARVLVVPDGSLNLVSIAALPAEDRSYLAETGPRVHYLSAERDVVPPAGTPRRGRGLLALGGPAYGDSGSCTEADITATRSSCGSFDTLRFDPLPGTEAETRDVVEIWKRGPGDGSPSPEPVVHLHGARASEAAFKDRAPGSRVLHLATHGFFIGGECASGLERSRGLHVVEVASASAGTPLSPLLLSGLALAGANRRASAAAGSEDGILTAEEIASMDLSGVDMMVLSACDTGVGEIHAGEGVFGLRRAIQVAGVRSLVMSLWPVDDTSTAAWMRAFYRERLSDGAGMPDAVRDAGLEVMRQRRDAGESDHPFYWAAFVAAGDWR